MTYQTKYTKADAKFSRNNIREEEMKPKEKAIEEGMRYYYTNDDLSGGFKRAIDIAIAEQQKEIKRLQKENTEISFVCKSLLKDNKQQQKEIDDLKKNNVFLYDSLEIRNKTCKQLKAKLKRKK